jgi:hypothetical protein
MSIEAKRRLKLAAAQIAACHGKDPIPPCRAFSKLFLAPRWIGEGVQDGWKAGELIEFFEALILGRLAASHEEWGDVGYYISQTWGWLWWVYASLTPAEIIEGAVRKFEGRAKSDKEGQRNG